MKSWSEINHRLLPVASNTKIAEGAYLLSLKRDFSFLSGQVVALGVNTTLAPRLYSIASGEFDDMVDILYTEKSGGGLTPMLSRLKTGDNVMVSEPFGTFTEVSNNAVYICAGTGIAPFIAKIKSMKGSTPTLIHGVSYPEHFYFNDYLNKTLGRNYIQCCSRHPGEDYFLGRVTKFVKEWNYLDTTKRYYLCGSAEMVVDTRDELIARGVPFANINAEIYF
jgi:ferredoxin--NADP+ reductase